MKIRISLDSKNFDRKPTKKETAHISNRIAKSSTEILVENFAKFTVQPYGRSFSSAVFGEGQRTNASWKSQQVFALDIDNGLTVKEALKKCNEFNLMPAFIYTTFSSTSDYERFRIVFILEHEIEDIRVREFVQKSLIKVFPQTDTMAGDAARIMFGGKEIVYNNFENTVSVIDICHAASAVIRNGPNPTRDMENFCRSAGVDMYNGYPKLVIFNNDKDMPKINEEHNVFVCMTKNGTTLLNNSSLCVENSPMNYVIFFSKPNTKEFHISSENKGSFKFDIQKQREKKKLIRNYPYEELYKNCTLYREAIEGRYWLHHMEIFGIMTNLLQIEGGSTKVEQILNSRKEYAEKADSWSTMANQIIKSNYQPCQCEYFCPMQFESNCNHCLNMIEQGKLVRGRIHVMGKTKARTLEEAENELSEKFESILDNDKKGIYIIKAPTGIGKTELYLNACKNKNLTVAVPTHELKCEISEKMKSKGIHHFVMPELPKMSAADTKELQRLYDSGSFRGANIFLKQKAKECEEVERYLGKLKNAKKISNETIITTHHRLLYDKDFNDTVIVDEDIILNAMFPISHIKMGDLSMVNAKIRMKSEFAASKGTLQGIEQEILNAQYGLVKETPSYFLHLAEEIERMIIEDETIDSNILGFLNSSRYVKVNGPDNIEYIYFIGKRHLPDKKIVILSATINENIAKIVFGNDIFFYDMGEIEQKGEIIQIPTKSYSKYSINRDYDGMLNMAEKLIELYNPNSKVITYKNYFQDLINTNFNFWNTAGRDNLKGENITIIGTPHVNPLRYLLFSSVLGYSIRLDDSIMSYQPVTRGIYKFYFQTYSRNDFLREIQFYMIESELIQTVGRARTLREPSKVLLLSNFPVPGAEFIFLSQQELNEYKKKNIE
ncbi:hypothetical protein HNQ80_001179 [Anaerosolibacter carboniphilus]|uniref:Helicase ATP-binding domain-containing protein n=1 Tax=Anaerosolibacter carboniphilus TaxID=1417629 RepID=A0A841KSS8_9FIRM|nr:hypothetical protein [Anaerosolibacter carboniphilus]MBB6215090.1 hypothetical protein [Anaerosolibacter carboniphilus]